MSQSQVTQLARGLWFVHRNQFLIGLSGIIACVFMTRIAMNMAPSSPHWIALCGIILATPCLFLLTAIFSYCDLMGRIEGPESTFPRFLARLPIASSVYVTTSVVGLILSVAVWWGTIDYAVLTESVRDALPAALKNRWLLLILPILVLVSVLSLGYSMALTAFDRSWVRVVIAPFLCVLPVVLLVAGLEAGLAPSIQIAAQSLVCALSLIVYQVCFHYGRHGTEVRFAIPLRLRWSSRHPLSIEPFSSPESSQFWFEWSRHGVGLLIATIPTVLLTESLCGAWLYVSDAYAIRVLVCLSMIGIALFVPVGVGSALGLGVLPLKSRLRNYVGMPAFYATRPISDRAIVITLMNMTALSIVLGIAASLVIATVVGSLCGANSFTVFLLGKAIEVYGFATVATCGGILGMIAFVAGFKLFAMNLLLNLTSKMWLWWINYWGRFLFLFLAVSWFWVWMEAPKPFVIDPYWSIGALLALVSLKWCVTAVMVRRILDWKLCSFAQVRLGLQVWLFLVLVLSGATMFVLRDFPVPSLVVLASFVVFVPINRLFACVLVTHSVRHQ